jgi:hypothetical protein
MAVSLNRAGDHADPVGFVRRAHFRRANRIRRIRQVRSRSTLTGDGRPSNDENRQFESGSVRRLCCRFVGIDVLDGEIQLILVSSRSLQYSVLQSVRMSSNGIPRSSKEVKQNHCAGRRRSMHSYSHSFAKPSFLYTFARTSADHPALIVLTLQICCAPR